ncbi:MAG: hypothetical protein QOD07_327 [Frankiaceae bacterium]|jgi:hypothetical protein|nr:hypothetical protein [Frankiaceae bacterium]
MARRFVALLGAVVSLLAWVLPVQQAAATTWSSRSLGHTPFTCSDTSMWVKHYVNANTTIYAAATDKCGHFSFVTGSPTAGYHVERTPFGGYKGSADNIDAIARDGTTTYFLRRNPEYVGRLEIWARSSTGKYTLFKLLTGYENVGQNTHPDDLVVAGGHWTAAWTQLVNGKSEVFVNSTLAGHNGRAQVATPTPASFGDWDPYVVLRTSTDAEVVYRTLGASDAAALHLRHVVQGGFSADRVLVHVTGSVVVTGRVLARSSAAYFLFNDYFDSTQTHALGLISDTGSAAHSATAAKGNLYGQLAVDSVSGHLFAVTSVFQTGTSPTLYSNASGAWRGAALAVGTRDIGFDALTAYSSKVAVYYSPAGTYQDTVYYQH